MIVPRSHACAEARRRTHRSVALADGIAYDRFRESNRDGAA
jgi:hypothetical protein